MISTQFLVASGQRRANQLAYRLQIAPVGQAAIRKQHGMCNQLKFMPRPPRSCSEHTGIEKFIPGPCVDGAAFTMRQVEAAIRNDLIRHLT
jgi:hypothetical protein